MVGMKQVEVSSHSYKSHSGPINKRISNNYGLLKYFKRVKPATLLRFLIQKLRCQPNQYFQTWTSLYNHLVHNKDDHILIQLNFFFFLVKFSYLRKMPVAGSCTRSRLSCSNSFSTTMERSNPVAEAIEYTGICAQAQILLVSEPPNFGDQL